MRITLIVLALIAIGVGISRVAVRQGAVSTVHDDSLYGFSDICIQVRPHRVPRKVGGYHLATKECRSAKYWTVVNGRFVPKEQ